MNLLGLFRQLAYAILQTPILTIIWKLQKITQDQMKTQKASQNGNLSGTDSSPNSSLTCLQNQDPDIIASAIITN